MSFTQKLANKPSKRDFKERGACQKTAKSIYEITSAPNFENAVSAKEVLKKRDLKERGACQKTAKSIYEITPPNFEKADLSKEALYPKSKHRVKKISRAIPSYLRTYIWKRDGGQCTYVRQETTQKTLLELFFRLFSTHRLPFLERSIFSLTTTCFFSLISPLHGGIRN